MLYKDRMPGWDIDADSPLLPFVGAARGRARFEVAAPSSTSAVGDGGNVLLAGAAEVDITPPPGIPKAGYSANAHIGAGFRTRLRARIVHLRSSGTSIVLVQCDLLGGSAVLQHLVARGIADHTDVPLEGVFIGATHTHAGPGQFLGTDFYNRFASNRSGFDPAFAQFLASRITAGVREAVDTRREARLAVGSTEVWGLTRNRSHDPYVHNSTVGDKRTDPQRKFVAVNPDLHMIRVDARSADGGFEPLAAALVFAIHGTGVSQHADEYNADVWAYLLDEMSHRVEASTGARPVLGAMQGTHADVAPAIRPGMAGHLEAARVGRGVGEIAAALYDRLEGELRSDVELSCGLREVDLDAGRSIGGIELPNRPAVGAALAAGAAENLTPVLNRIGPFRPGHPRRHPSGPQAEKRIIGSRWLQPVVLPLREFPRILPIQVLRIDSTVLVGLPFELTVETGRRIRAAVESETAGSAVDRVVVSSVANEYCGYVTTPEEYRRQFYEGGHTLYGPRTQPFLAAHATRLVREVLSSGGAREVSVARHFSLRMHRYLARAERSGAARRVTEQPFFVDATANSDGYWQVDWVDESPGCLSWHERLVSVEVREGDGGWQPARRRGRVIDDQGCDIEVRYHGASDGLHRYVARWWNPAFHAQRQHRFVLEANGPQPRATSAPFD